MFSILALASLALPVRATVLVPEEEYEQARDERLRNDWVLECEDWDNWDKPAPAFRVYGNTWHVGTCGISVILIATLDGAIIIDAGPAEASRTIRRNIERTGMARRAVRLLLQSHEHYDHVGGMANLQRWTGAALIASKEAAPVMGSGMASADDPQYGMHDRFPAARVDRVLDESMTVTLGALTLHAIATPGHTPGALTWYWESCDGEDCRTIVYADSLTPVSADSYRFSDHPQYLAAFRNSIDAIAALDCDILLTPHPSASNMIERLAGIAPLIDPKGCKAYAEKLRHNLDERVAREEASGKP